MEQFLQKGVWRLVDESNLAERSPLASFAMDDTLCHLVGHGESDSTIRTWVHEQSVVLGIQDHRLPYIEEGLALLQAHHYTPIVRNSGGLAVVLDRGVLNISIVVSERQAPISIAAGFEMMVALIRLLLPELEGRIDVYEIVGSYCPGSYDVSVDGKKFAGISQRRMQGGVAVQIYVCIEGSGSERAHLVKQFYDTSLRDAKTKFTYPVIVPHVMASVQELTNSTLTVVDFNLRLQQLLQTHCAQLNFMPLQPTEQALYTTYLERVLKRNTSMLVKQ